MKMIVMQGLPASGKSTRAEEIMKNDGNTFRVNRDKLREMMHFNKWTRENEKLVIAAEENVAGIIMSEGKNVIIDDTNLTFKHISRWASIAKAFKADLEIESLLNVPLTECIARDAARLNPVGRSAIMDMVLRNKVIELQDVVVCDIDGTVADLSHRLQYAKGETKNWQTFFSLLHLDTPRTDVWEQVKKEVEDNVADLIFVSARPETYRKETEAWLKEHNMDNYLHLIMRGKNDKREDTIVKSEIYDKYLADANVVSVFDDRPSVIRMWREKGLTVHDVGEGIEF